MLLKFLKQINEKYSFNNSYLLNYLKNKEIDQYHFIHVIVKWFEENPEYIENAKELSNESNLSDDEFLSYLKDYKINPDFFYHLDSGIKKEITGYIIDYIISHDPDGAPTWSYVDLGNREKLIKRNTWLIHFSDYAYEIAREGFTKGVEDFHNLGYTKSVSDSEKKHGGYNFAYLADGYFTKDQIRNYGNHAVMFQNSGVSIHHEGDRENQIIFWGADVDPRGIVLLNYNNEDEWEVLKHPLSRSSYDEDEPVFTGDIDDIMKWVIKNWRQYSKIIMGY